MPPDLKVLTDQWYNDPVQFVLDSYRSDPEGAPVTVDEPQRKILNAVARHDRVAVRSSHGVGKTTTASWLTMWHLVTRFPALVVTLAGTWNHLEDKLWPEIHTWGRQWRLKDAWEWQRMGLYAKSAPDQWRAVASSSDDAEHVEGWHSPNLLVIIDEAKAMPDELYTAIRGALTSTSSEGAKPKLVVLSTPPMVKAGWYSDLFSAKSTGWHTIHVSAEESPRVSKEWAEEMAQDFGLESAAYQSKVLGEIPEGAAEAVIELRWIEAAQKRQAKADQKPVIVTCDVAREGEDLTVIGRFRNGKAEIIRWKAKNDLMEVAGMCVQAATEHRANTLIVDDSGLGGGVTDRLNELKREGKFPKDCSIVGKKFGEGALRDERFANAKAEMWWSLRDALRSGLLALQSDHELAALQLPRSSSLVAQLTAPIYEEDSRSRIKVLDKRIDNREKTRGLPTKSPDLAHALILGAWSWLRAREVVKDEPPKTLEEMRAREHQAYIRKLLNPEPEGNVPERYKNL